jgi:hypothetical protein
VRVLLVTAMVVAFAGVASALPVRFYLKSGKTQSQALAYFEKGFNQQSALSGTRCRFTDGTATSGWLHVACAGRDTVAGAVHRFTVVYMPLTCTSMQIRLVIVGVARTTRKVGWSRDSPLRCRRT